MESVTPPLLPPAKRQKFTLFLKIGGICFLILLLHVPLAMTEGVLRERSGSRIQAIGEMSETWGQSQLVTGPLLVVPWTQTLKRNREGRNAEGKFEIKEETYTASGAMYFLPETLEVQARLDSEIRYRGIYEAVVYGASTELKGSFNVPASPDVQPDTVYHWERARMYFNVSDSRRLRSSPVAVFGDVPTAIESNNSGDAPGLSLMAATPTLVPAKEVRFSIELELQGSERFDVASVGRQTVLNVASSWGDPSFNGAHLPISREVSDMGFTAKWAIGPFGRDYPFSWNSKNSDVASLISKFARSTVGVSLLQPVDGYRQAERAQKYGVLFFVLVFAVFFLFEVSAPLRIHPLQYAMVGAALCLFFLGFLALSEFLATGLAYAIAAAACTAMVALYSMSVLKSGRRTSVVAGGLAATYGYLYFVLKSQDYALLAGTAALFIALAIVMFFTRRIDWYSLEMNTAAGSAK